MKKKPTIQCRSIVALCKPSSVDEGHDRDRPSTFLECFQRRKYVQVQAVDLINVQSILELPISELCVALRRKHVQWELRRRLGVNGSMKGRIKNLMSGIPTQDPTLVTEYR